MDQLTFAAAIPNTCSTTKITALKSANTARLVTMNRNMRFIGLFFGEINHNMIAPPIEGRDASVEFHCAP